MRPDAPGRTPSASKQRWTSSPWNSATPLFQLGLLKFGGSIQEPNIAPNIPIGGAFTHVSNQGFYWKIRYILSLGVFGTHSRVDSIAFCRIEFLSSQSLGGASVVDKLTRYCMTDINELDFTSGVAAFEAKNFSQAMTFLSPLAEAGDPDAQHRVAIMCQNGLGMVRNETRALKMMRAAAEQGFALAQHGLGFMYLEGDCVDQDSAKAVQWFRRAADQGLAGSMITLAKMYEDGNGVEKDPEMVKQLYKQAGFDL